MRRRTIRTKPGRTASRLAALLVGVLLSSGAAALDDLPARNAEPGIHPVAALPGARAAAPTESHEGTALKRLGDRLKRIPLRPVRIGRTPRLPRDPEPGMGVVVRLTF